MAHQLLRTPEEIYNEFMRQEAESEDGENFDLDNSSETEDDLLSNSDNEEDVFHCAEGRPYNEKHPVDSQSDVEERNFELGKDLESIWTDKPIYSKFSRTTASNIITHLPGPRGEARGITNEMEIFLLFINSKIIEKIVLFTNLEIVKSRQKYNTVQWFLSPTDDIEIKGLMGLLFMSGVLKNSMLSTDEMFSVTYGPPVFRCTMSKKRFAFLLENLRFDDKATREVRKVKDKFAAFREVWEIFESNCEKNYSPSEYVTVDETLLSFRGACPFKTYIPSKPDKYGLKIMSLCDARTFYFLRGIPYTGKNNRIKRRPGELPLPAQYVLSLTECIRGSNRNVTTDNWFSSLELTDALLQNKLTFVGTLRKNKPQVPPSMLLSAPEGSSKFMYQDDKTLVAFTPKKNKKVLLISSMHFSGDISEKINKPEIVEFYNLTKGGVDVLDMLCHSRTTKRKSRRWPMRYFYAILDIAAINSYIIYKSNSKMDSFSNYARISFLKTLALSLAKPLMEKRLNNVHLPRELRSSIGKLLEKEPIELEKPFQAQPQKKRRCDFCDRSKDRNIGRYVGSIKLLYVLAVMKLRFDVNYLFVYN